MRTKSLKWPLFMSMAMLLALPVLFEGQTTEDQQRQQMGMESHVGTLTGRAKDGQKAYERYCIGCHGALGDGAGENAQWMEPQPRNFTRATFRCRSTPTGTLPTDEDLYDTIGRGLLNSNMPQWRPLSKQERADMVAYVKHFSTRYASEKPGAPIEIPAEPEVTAERIKAGQASFQNLHDRPGWITDAVLCRHGQAGSGVESGVLSSHVATDAFESEDHCQTAGIETGESGRRGRTRLNTLRK